MTNIFGGNVKISFAILCKDESDSLEQVLKSIVNYRGEYESEIVIVKDSEGNNPKTNEILEKYYKFLRENESDFVIYSRPLNNNFSSQKNFMTEKCGGDWVFNCDADEIPPKYLLENIHLIIEQNNSELIWLPRINIIDGLTNEWIQRFGFRVFPEVSKGIGIINEKVMDTESEEYKLLKNIGLIIEERKIRK